MCAFVYVCVCVHVHFSRYQELRLKQVLLKRKHHSLGEGCSHVAAVLFKVEAAVRNGYTSVTSNTCQWNQAFSKKVLILLVLIIIRKQYYVLFSTRLHV